MNEIDERIEAWERIARHQLFAECYDKEAPLVVSMLERLDRLMATLKRAENERAENVRAEEPVEWRILRAFTNGFSEGLRRAAEGRYDR